MWLSRNQAYEWVDVSEAQLVSDVLYCLGILPACTRAYSARPWMCATSTGDSLKNCSQETASYA